MGYEKDYWIEKIGSASGPLYSMFMAVVVCPTWDLLCFHESDSLLYIQEGVDGCWNSGVGMRK